MTALLALIFKIVGVGFLFVAAIGVIRFTDSFQRMHAATKAGTLGASLVILGSIISQNTPGATTMGLLTIVFLLLTVPVAGHMLGRAAYISGAGMAGLRGPDELEGILERQKASLEDRVDGRAINPRFSRPAPEKYLRVPSVEDEPQERLRDLEEVRLAIIEDTVDTVVPRALAIAASNDAHLSAYTLIDKRAIEATRDPRIARADIRARAMRAMAELESLKGDSSAKIELTYDEGDPEKLLACRDEGKTLLVLPRDGWFHHGSDHPRPGMSWDPDGLLRLPAVHRGPVLYVGGSKQVGNLVVVRDLGEPHLFKALDWSLRSSVWGDPRIVISGKTSRERLGRFRLIAARYNRPCEHEDSALEGDIVLPQGLHHAQAILLGREPRPLRTRWYGQPWYDRLIPNYRGDVLIVCA